MVQAVKSRVGDHGSDGEALFEEGEGVKRKAAGFGDLFRRGVLNGETDLAAGSGEKEVIKVLPRLIGDPAAGLF